MTTETTRPRFSIVMPSFNTAEYLRETIESVLSQDYPDFEFIVTDGGSTDGTIEILQSYGDRIKWVSEPDKGQCDAINKGFAMATGELHYWANADDPLLPGALSHVASLLTRLDEPQWAVGAASLINGNGKQFEVRSVDKVDDTTFLLWALKWIPTQTVFWNRKMWEAAGPFDEHLHYVMDLGLWERMHRTAPCVVTDKLLACYRLHHQSKSLSGLEKSRAERKTHLARLIAADMSEAHLGGKDAVDALAVTYARLMDELADQTALLERMRRHRVIGWLLRRYKQRGKWVPDLNL